MLTPLGSSSTVTTPRSAVTTTSGGQLTVARVRRGAREGHLASVWRIYTGVMGRLTALMGRMRSVSVPQVNTAGKLLFGNINVTQYCDDTDVVTMTNKHVTLTRDSSGIRLENGSHVTINIGNSLIWC